MFICSVLVNQHSEKLINTKYFIRVYFTLGFCLSNLRIDSNLLLEESLKFLKSFDAVFCGAFNICL